MTDAFSNLRYFSAQDHAARAWEKFYRNRWQHDKVVRSTHGVNCTGSCSWKIFVKKGIVTWEIQATDYPDNGPDMPNHEPRGCPRGASYSWYLYNSGRVKHPMIRRELLELWEKAKEKGYVEKGNKDEVFRYHIAKVDEEDDSLQDAPEITNEDLVLGIRPEFLDIADSSNLRGEIYGAMPTGMESTIKVRVGGFLLTGVIFGSSLFTIGAKIPLSITGDQIMLFDRKSGRCITSGSLTF